MSQPQQLTNRVLDYVLETARDHQQLLRDVAVRVEPFEGEWTNAYAQACAQLVEHQALPSELGSRALVEQTVQVLLGGLRQGNLFKYYTDLGDWARKAARAGISYDQLLLIVREFERSGLPFIRRVCPSLPELQLIFGALDDWYSGAATVIGAVFTQMAQEQLMDSARSRVAAQLATGAAHMINNILTGVLGRTELLIERTRDLEMRGELQDIQVSANMGAQTVRRLQDFVRARRAETFVELDLNQSVREAAEVTRSVWRDQAEANGIVVDLIKDLADVPPVLGRPAELREMLVALILNAVEAMPRGGLVTLRSERKDENVLLSVTDTGEGMSEDTRQHAFAPFFTTKGEDHVGLGLSTAAAIAGDHKGAITLTSELGRGTTVTLSVPVAPKTTPKAQEPAVVVERPVKILVVDDDPNVRDVMSKFLTHRGYQIAIAENGADAITAFKRSHVDLVITDLGMPGFSGWDVARQIKRLNPQTLVVLMTGWVVDTDPMKAKENGVDRIIQKPFKIDEVLGLVDEAVALRDKM